jgi:hypothetical protein
MIFEQTFPARHICLARGRINGESTGESFARPYQKQPRTFKTAQETEEDAYLILRKK